MGITVSSVAVILRWWLLLQQEARRILSRRMFYRPILGITRPCVWVIPALAVTISAQANNLVWQMGELELNPRVTIHVGTDKDSELLDPGFQFRGEDPTLHLPAVGAAARAAAGTRSLPQLPDVLIVYLLIHSQQGTYLVEETTTTYSAQFAGADGSLAVYPGSPSDAIPWLANIPQQIKFAVKGKAVYFLDAKRKKRKGKIIDFQRGS